MPKVSFTPDEVIQIAHGHLIGGIHQHLLASMFAMDSGRVAEVVVALRWAAENHKLIYRHVAKRKKLDKAAAAMREPQDAAQAPVKMLVGNALWPAGNGHYDGSD